MPGFDKVGAYQTVDSTDREDETNSQCQSQPDDTNNVKGKILQDYYLLALFYYKYLKLHCFTFLIYFFLTFYGL